jgi:hypothetical protein
VSNEHSNAAPGQNKTINIIINGTQEAVSGHEISYEEVVLLAFPGQPVAGLYTVAYANPHGKDGTLAPGQSTQLKEGMSFNVVKTNRS